MKRDFAARMSQIGQIMRAVYERGDEWFENINLKNSVELMQRGKIRERFRDEVVADTQKLLDDGVSELIGWMVDRNLKQWRSILEYATPRRQASSWARWTTASSTTAARPSPP